MSVRCFIGASSMSIAMMNEAKSPTVARLACACSMAMYTITPRATAASMCVIGVLSACGTLSRMLKPRRIQAALLKRRDS
jgi:hypothetical protein